MANVNAFLVFVFVGLTSLLPSTAFGGSRFVIIESGATFSFTQSTEHKATNHPTVVTRPIEGSAAGRSKSTYYSNYVAVASSKIEIQYENKTYILPSALEESGFSSLSRAEEKSVQLEESLGRSEMMALSLMQKNMSVVDDPAELIKDKPVILTYNASFPAEVEPTKIAFRYALIMEVKNDAVVSYKFIRQGAEDAVQP